VKGIGVCCIVAHTMPTQRCNTTGNPTGSFTPAACIDWRIVRRFHLGTGHADPAYDAGYTTARASKLPNLSIRSLDFGELHIRRVRHHFHGHALEFTKLGSAGPKTMWYSGAPNCANKRRTTCTSDPLERIFMA
jgi:hypothetical protein